jgi:hypothetical protein
MNRFSLSLAGILVFWMSTTPASAAVVFSDGVFNDLDWSGQQFLDGSFVVLQVGSGGNPNEYQRIDLTNLDSGQSAIVVNLKTGAVYDPSISGAISSIDFSFDLFFLGGSPGTSVVGYRLALEQSGSFFYSGPGTSFVGVAQGPGNGLPGSGWDSFSFSGLSANDFVRLSGTSQLDFSATGAPITFGYLAITGMSLPNVVDGSTTSGIDNWNVRVTPVPEPTTMLLLGIGLTGAVCTRVVRAGSSKPQQDEWHATGSEATRRSVLT